MCCSHFCFGRVGFPRAPDSTGSKCETFVCTAQFAKCNLRSLLRPTTHQPKERKSSPGCKPPIPALRSPPSNNNATRCLAQTLLQPPVLYINPQSVTRHGCFVNSSFCAADPKAHKQRHSLHHRSLLQLFPCSAMYSGIRTPSPT